MRVARLGCRDDDGLDTNETEGCVDQRRQDTEEVTRRALDAVVVSPCTRIVPVIESNRVSFGTSAGRDDNGNNDEAKEAQNLPFVVSTCFVTTSCHGIQVHTFTAPVITSLSP